MSKNFSINLKTLVIGNSLEALLFAYYNKYKILYCVSRKPEELDRIEDFGLGTNPLAIWKKRVFLMSMAGNIPFQDKIKHIAYMGPNNIKVVTHDETVVNVGFEKMYVFDDANFFDLPPAIETTSDRVRIIDWFYVERGCIHNYEKVINDTDFMKEIIFFKSSKKRTAKRKDVCVVTYCNRQDIQDMPEHLIKIKTEKLMRELGIETATAHKTHIKIEHQVRDIYEYGKNIYENFDNIEFMYSDAKFIHDVHGYYRKIDYMKYLTMKLQLP